MKLVIIPSEQGDSFAIINEKFPPNKFIDVSDMELINKRYSKDDLIVMLRSFNFRKEEPLKSVTAMANLQVVIESDIFQDRYNKMWYAVTKKYSEIRVHGPFISEEQAEKAIECYKKAHE